MITNVKKHKDIKSAIAMLGNSDSVIKVLKDDVDTLDKINSMFDELLTKAGEKYKAEHENGQKNNAEGSAIKKSMKRTFSYSELTSKPDMKLTLLIESVPKDINGKIDRSTLVEKAVENAKKIGETNAYGNATVYVEDVGREVTISKASIRHGLDRRIETQAPALLNIGEILKNSIEINQLNAKKKTAESSYILLGAAKDGDNIYIVSSIVNRFTNSIDSIDVLYSANIKKEPAVSKTRASGDALQSLTDSTVSISDLLDIVKDKCPEILSNDVLKHYGLKRGNSEIEKALKYSMKSSTDNLSELKGKRSELTDEYRALRMQIDEIKESAEYVAFNEEVRTVKKNGSFFGKMEKVKEIRSRQKAWANSKGLSELEERYHDISEQIHDYDLEIYKLDKAQKEKITAELTDKVKGFNQNKENSFIDLVTLFVTKNNRKGSQSVPPATQSSSQRGSASNNIISKDSETVKDIDELAEISKQYSKSKKDTKNHIIAKDSFVYRTVYFEDYDGKYYKLTLSIGNNNGKATVYNIGQIKKDSLPGGNIVHCVGFYRSTWI